MHIPASAEVHGTYSTPPSPPSSDLHLHHITIVTKSSMVYNLTNRNVLVTGGSRGLGAVTVERFAKEGANIVVNYLSSKEAAEELVLRIKSTYGVRAVAIGA